MIALLALLACKDEAPPDTAADDSAATGEDSGADDSAADDSAADDSATDDSAEPEELVCGEVPALPEPSIVGHRMSAEVTWSLDFDAEGEANGFVDCSYSRTYEAAEILDQDYLCPSCDVIFRGEATVTEGADCVAQISSGGTVREEQWGFTWAGTLYRTGTNNAPIGELTEFTVPAEGEAGAITWSSENSLTAGGTMLLEAAGTLTWWQDPELLLRDPWAPRTAPYAAGWPQDNPGTLTLDYDLQPGGVLPNVRLEDQCGDVVELWDFYGRYLVIDASQYDCGPCQAMARTEHDFLQAIRAEGYAVNVLTFMGNGLSDSLSEPQPGIIDQWVEAYGITEPVLADRGYTYAMLAPYLYDTTGEDYGYPAWLVVAPDMTVISGNVGFGSWDDVGEIIRAHAASR